MDSDTEERKRRKPIAAEGVDAWAGPGRETDSQTGGQTDRQTEPARAAGWRRRAGSLPVNGSRARQADGAAVKAGSGHRCTSESTGSAGRALAAAGGPESRRDSDS